MSDYLFHNQQLALIAGTMISMMLFLLWDDFNKRSGASQNIQTRWPGNLFLAALNTLLVVFALEPALKPVSQFIAELLHNKLGWIAPLTHTEYHWIVYFIPAILVYELVDYVIHRFAHRLPWLWRLHATHHTDTRVDATTAHRHHPLEIVVNSFLGAPFLVAIGVPIMVAIWHPLIRMVLIAFNHSNSLLPDWLDKPLSYVLATPNFHRIHHFSERQYTNSNYGTIFSFYDHLFGTAKYLPKAELETKEIGLEYLRNDRENNPLGLLISPASTVFSASDRVRNPNNN
ncbi:sterol desaturase family protein [Pseudoteredinibacter isoporae]|uniref:Sterol desaturase/sphingolipid hydroxylase (Fatty acid hydroxylase superfamily) n=1 Tax=Pseudoteredinibacter isoporae TaxID=570281 RepID=A0A7X0JQI9_9GAMM|nr:sterol desaturase family protein [Pseudoteredinibacter isoporae]MBB6519944.1 sterol desaturase/sphingolipid hydroxylase (fatty acid hydroxylase superfamily) [Pseudoteredinibacter isoporae]NHO85519.1 sterol desaturase family protein [Pseudoteredinibacter isoporae]NIB26029.1 sterol desaturase family protein [Pseudoteredinibacter isoporae]